MTFNVLALASALAKQQGHRWQQKVFMSLSMIQLNPPPRRVPDLLGAIFHVQYHGRSLYEAELRLPTWRDRIHPDNLAWVGDGDDDDNDIIVRCEKRRICAFKIPFLPFPFASALVSFSYRVAV
jgi:hypothetical protein